MDEHRGGNREFLRASEPPVFDFMLQTGRQLVRDERGQALTLLISSGKHTQTAYRFVDSNWQSGKGRNGCLAPCSRRAADLCCV